MSGLPFSRENYRREVILYHGLPTITAVLLIAFLVMTYILGGNFAIAFAIAGLFSFCLVWRWILAGRQIEYWGCPHCQEPFPKRTYWTYPPKVCPRCGKSVAGRE